MFGFSAWGMEECWNKRVIIFFVPQTLSLIRAPLNTPSPDAPNTWCTTRKREQSFRNKGSLKDKMKLWTITKEILKKAEAAIKGTKVLGLQEG